MSEIKKAETLVTPVLSEYHELVCPTLCGGTLRCYSSETMTAGNKRSSTHRHRCTECGHEETRTDNAFPFIAHAVQRHGGKVYVSITR